VWAGREREGATHLQARGYEVFLPCYQERRRWSDRVKTVQRALFTGYVFARVRGDVVAGIVTTPFVVRIVGNGDGPLPVPTVEIDALRTVVETRLAAEPWPFLQAGQRVRVETGPLRNVEGIVLAAKNSHRLIVSISLLQRSVAVEMEPSWVAGLAPGPAQAAGGPTLI